MFKKIRKYLHRECNKGDVVAMTRIQSMGATHEVDVNDYPADQKKHLAKEAESIFANEAFKVAANNLRMRVLKYIRDEAKDADEILRARFTLNGLALLEEELMGIMSFKEDKDLTFDKFSPI